MEKCTKCGNFNWGSCRCKLFYLAVRDEIFSYNDKREINELSPKELAEGYWRKIYAVDAETAAEKHMLKLCYSGDGIENDTEMYVFDGENLIKLTVVAELVVETHVAASSTVAINADILTEAIDATC